MLRTVDERNQLVAANTRLTTWVVARMQRAGKVWPEHFEDAVQEGMFGLVRAAELWDTDYRTSNGKPVSFAHYAKGWIEGQVGKWLCRQALISVPYHRFLAGERCPEFDRLYREDGDSREQIDPSAVDPVQAVAERDEVEWQRAQVADAALLMPERWQQVLEHRLRRGETLQDVAERMGVCRERVRQIETKAMAFLRERVGA